jgi:ferritin-like metal-binding protein YciE
MAVDSLRTHLVEELFDLLDAENQLIKALPRMAKSATTALRKTAFQRHLAALSPSEAPPTRSRE